MKKLSDFEIRSDTGEVCISGDLDYETRNSYEFPIIATDRGKERMKKYKRINSAS
jgi:protocadherin-16/23